MTIPLTTTKMKKNIERNKERKKTARKKSILEDIQKSGNILLVGFLVL